jgi:hypothetical protein
MVNLIPTCIVSSKKNYCRMILLNFEKQCIYMSKLNSEKIWKLWKKSRLNSEMIWKIQKKSKLNSEKIWKLWKRSWIVKWYGKIWKKGKLNGKMIWKIWNYTQWELFNLLFFPIFHIFSLFNLPFFHIVHIFSLFNLSFFYNFPFIFTIQPTFLP